MPSAALTSKGQTTIPKEIREALALKPGDRLNFTLMQNGTVLMRACNKPASRLLGIAGYDGPVIAVEDMRLGA